MSVDGSATSPTACCSLLRSSTEPSESSPASIRGWSAPRDAPTIVRAIAIIESRLSRGAAAAGCIDGRGAAWLAQLESPSVGTRISARERAVG